MALVGYFCPKNVHGGFQMLTGFVQQINVGGILDVRRGYSGIHNELPAIFLLLLFPFQFLFGAFLSLLPLLDGRFCSFSAEDF